jgi:hypothetical protein
MSRERHNIGHEYGIYATWERVIIEGLVGVKTAMVAVPLAAMAYVVVPAMTLPQLLVVMLSSAFLSLVI